ncbi:MAG: ATP-binding protein [Firmicutes bacterium]|nr:ATP-binding protein [Bacillota bacterium]
MHRFYGLSLLQKLLLAFISVLIIAIAIMIFSIVRINTLVNRYSDLLSTVMERQAYLGDATNALTKMRLFTAYRALALDNREIAEHIDIDIPAYEAQEQAFLAGWHAYQYVLSQLDVSQREQVEFELLLQNLMATYMTYTELVIPSIISAVENEDRGSLHEAIILGVPTGNRMSELLREVREAVESLARNDEEEAENLAMRTINTILAAYILATVFIILVCFFMSHIIRKPVEALRAAAGKIADGDLTYPIRQSNNSEIGKLSGDIADMVDSISEMNRTVTIMDNLDLLMFVVDRNKDIIYMNRSMLQAYGLPHDTLVSLSRDDNRYELDMLKNVHNVHDIMPHGNGVSYQNLGIHWDSCLGKWMEVRNASIRWIDGSNVQLYSLFDVTKQKEHEDEKDQYEKMLEEAVEASQMASLAKSTFIANTSHEIRTPMNSIIGYAELALGFENMSDKVRDYLENILGNSKLLLQIINDILDISKIEAGKLDIETVPFDLQKVLVHCQAAIQPLVENKNLTLHFYLEPNVNKLLLGSPTRLSQVFINLLSNAVKFTNSGIIKVSSTVVDLTEDSCTLTFTVRDSGIGMTKEQISSIFDPFTQADESIGRKYGGSGLGLTITKNLIEAMGGVLEVESVLRIGSKFSFTITFPTVEMQSDEYVSTIDERELSKPQFTGDVLICEDNHMNQGVIREHLEKVGLTTFIASNGKIGVELVQQRHKNNEPPFGLIFMDVNMPVMDGLEAAKLIQRFNTGTPIVAMTANVMVNDLESYKKSGMEDIISKPFTTQELWRCLLKYFVPIHWTEEDVIKVQKSRDTFRIKVAERFVKNNSGVYEDMANCLAEGNVEQAHRLIHNLKAHAGMVERQNLYEIAAKIEASLAKNINTVTDGDMDILRKEFELTMEELVSILNKAGGKETEAKDNYDNGMIRLWMDELESLVEDGNLKYLSYVDKLSSVPGSDELICHLENFDETNALIAMRRLREALGQ